MRAAVALADVVREAQHVLVIGIVPRQRRLDAHPVAIGHDHDRVRNESGLGAVEIAHERLEPAVIF